MVFGIDPVKMAKAELLKIDLNNDKIPDAIQALDAAEEGLKALASFFEGLDEEEAFAILSSLDGFRKPENRREPKELIELSKQVVIIAPALTKASQALDAVEAELLKKK